ncbi:hypothetical protein [Moorena producens]|uniref:hypothetical protein n=1 Tax=Moorena producens TaxID=1155739 RepID=UPI003C760EB7
MGRWGDGEMGRWGDGEMGELRRVRDKTGLPWFSGCWHRLGSPSRKAPLFLFPIPYSLFPIPCSLFPAPCSLA